MTGRTCQLCGKPLSRFTVGSGGDFCSREHRNQFRLRLGMDRLQEANKVASLMRRRENAKAIPASQLSKDCKVLPRVSPALRIPARQISLRSQPSSAELHKTRIAAVSRNLVTMRAEKPPARIKPRAIDGVNALSERPMSPLLRKRENHFPVQITQAGAVSFRLKDSRISERGREVATLGRSVARTNIGGNGIQVRALPPSASRICKEPQLARKLINTADRGRALWVSGGIGFRLPALQIRCVPFAALQTAPLLNSTQTRDTRVVSLPADVKLKPEVISLSVRGLFGPRPPAKNGKVEFHWPSAIVPGTRLPRFTASASRPCEIEWTAANPCPPQLRLKNGAVHFRSATNPRPISSTLTPRGIASAIQVTLVPFKPQETPFECSPTALHGTLVSGMMFGAPPVRRQDPANALTIEEHFDGGLQNWLGGTDDWKVDVAGVRAGSLALFTPSIELTDYQLEFLSRIENRSVNWVFRAANFDNYYQLTLASVPAGGYEFRRRAVVGGVPETPIGCPVPTTSSAPAARTAVTLRTRVSGDEFTVLLDGQVVDTWTDGRFTTGGIGFVGAPDDRARLYWVKVTPAGDRDKE